MISDFVSVISFSPFADHHQGFSHDQINHTVLMDSWYATRKLMLAIERLGKSYYCPIKSNRLVDETEGEAPHRRVDSLTWAKTELHSGKTVHLKKFPKGHRLKLFRLVLSPQRTVFVVTNDLSQDSAEATQIQRNHIACAMLGSVPFIKSNMAYSQKFCECGRASHL